MENRKILSQISNSQQAVKNIYQYPQEGTEELKLFQSVKQRYKTQAAMPIMIPLDT